MKPTQGSARPNSAFLSIEQASKLLRRRKISAVELLEESLARINKLNPALNVFITVTADLARRQARRVDRQIRDGKPRSLLHGIPVSLKDNFWTKDVRSTAGSKILADFVPDQDSEVAARLEKAGAILLGKTNLHEFAYGVTSENPHFGPVRNPWSRDRNPGGSSGGSAVAVAMGMGFASVGSDTGGSIRIPSALCGIVGLKPTFGLVSLAGVVPLSQTMDHAGPLARSVTDACIVLESIAGAYPKGIRRLDHRSLRRDRAKRFLVGWPGEYFFELVRDDVRNAINSAAKMLERLGGRIARISLPHLKDSVQASTDIALAEATRYHQSEGYFPARASDYGKDVRGRLKAGAGVRAVDYIRGFEMKRMLERDFDSAFEKVDAILAPASPIPAPRLGEDEVEIAGRKLPIRSVLVGACRPANFTGHPAISIPCGITREGLPIGLQLIGPRWGEQKLLAIALAYEEATPWHQRHPNAD